ncbi:TetR/AcrR family transcriptional regulator [Cryptosporangium sp. NPDC051539]|uniref:TetR/AcrR family transcriptional regulator n=1 Tax=Cryptosporangium sp. NPDC051539 TaxID=3363962 RepID=UPI003791DD65
MPRTTGLRERKKQQMRHQLADVAARLFAEHGYDAVSVSDVARAAGVSDQTVFNYFPTKPELVLDRAEEIREFYRETVRDRPDDVTPADALRPLVHGDIDRYARADLAIARGEFPAQCLGSSVLRRFALEARDQQADAIADAIGETHPGLHPLVVRAHAAALVAVIQVVTDRIGVALLDDAERAEVVAGLRADADAALDDASDHFRALTTGNS